MASCPRHGLGAEAHCNEMERMLEEVPGDFCELEGGEPHEAVRELRLAYEEAVADRDAHRAALADLVAAISKPFNRAVLLLKDGPTPKPDGDGS